VFFRILDTFLVFFGMFNKIWTRFGQDFDEIWT
jgi:hypothetical protein